MRGAWGKPYGTAARVNIGQVILSIRCKEQNAPVVMEALRRARYKFPGRQKIIISKKWGFTNVNKEEYLALKADKRVLQCVYRLSSRVLLANDSLTGMVPTSSTSAPRATSRGTCATSSALKRVLVPFLYDSIIAANTELLVRANERSMRFRSAFWLIVRLS